MGNAMFQLKIETLSKGFKFSSDHPSTLEVSNNFKIKFKQQFITTIEFHKLCL